MRQLAVCGVLSLCVALAGCGQQGTSGGPGATDSTARQNPLVQAENTFSLSPPMLATRIKQGQSDKVTIGIKRGKNFGEDVAIKFDTATVPAGVTIEPATPTVKASESEVALTVTAAANAALGSHTVKVTGQPGKGEVATNELKLSIVENK
jgi:hypothetical protein